MRLQNVLAHRGAWAPNRERNSLGAFKHAFEMGWGIELDVRDRDGSLVVSHDPPSRFSSDLKDVLALRRRYPAAGRMAINVKADGISTLLHQATAETSDWFAFDMSAPDTIPYVKACLPWFTRRSEYEPDPFLLQSAKGVWIDSFESDWWDEETLLQHTSSGRDVAIVSPELHGRPVGTTWRKVRRAFEANSSNAGEILICTDEPEAFLRGC